MKHVHFEEDAASFSMLSRAAKTEEFFKAQATSAMIALYPQLDVAKQLVLPDGEKSEDLHITLVLLPEKGHYAEPLRDPFVSPRFLQGLLAAFAALHGPLSGCISGFGCFRPQGKNAVFYASADIAGLDRFRVDLLKMIEEGGYAECSEHGFTPHITLQYMEPYTLVPTQWLPALPLSFSEIVLAIGLQRFSFRLTEF